MCYDRRRLNMRQAAQRCRGDDDVRQRHPRRLPIRRSNRPEAFVLKQFSIPVRMRAAQCVGDDKKAKISLVFFYLHFVA